MHMKLNPGLPWQKQGSPKRRLFPPENSSEVPWKFWNVVLEKDGEDQLDRSYEKWSLTYSQGGKKHPTSNKTKEC